MRVKYILTLREVLGSLMSLTQGQFDISFYKGGKYHKDNNVGNDFPYICQLAYYWTQGQNSPEFTEFPFFEYSSGTWKMTTHGKEIINAVFRQYGDEAFITCEDISQNDVRAVSTEALDDLMNLLNMTYDKYDKLLSLYDTQKAKLLNQIESSNGLTHSVAISETDNTDEATTDNMSANSSSENSGFNKFKDTPQSAVTIDSLGDDYNTDVNITKSETSGTDQSAESISRDIDRSLSRVENVTDAGTNKTDRDTPMARLDEIQRLYRKVLEQWVNEFKMLFWPIDNHFEMEE